MPDVVVFCFGGRRENIELQLPFVIRILDEHPGVEYHLWNLARNDADNHYLRSLSGIHPRLKVVNDFHGGVPWMKFNDVYRHYTQPRFENHLFVKLDDDVVFLESASFGDFTEAVRGNRGAIVSAQTINNGASTATIPELNSKFDKLGLPLLDVHLSGAYADLCHSHFRDSWRELVGQPDKLIPTDDWLSINVIGCDWNVLRVIASRLGTESPTEIAGRYFSPAFPLGDEGMVNTLPRFIYQGFLAAHLTFGPQHREITDRQVDDWRQAYAAIGREYLEAA